MTIVMHIDLYILTNIADASSDTSDFAPRKLNKTPSTSFSLPTLAFKQNPIVLNRLHCNHDFR